MAITPAFQAEDTGSIPVTPSNKLQENDNMRDLLKQTFTYRVETEDAAVALIEEEKAQSRGLVTYKTTYKTKKEKGEVVDSWYIVDVTHDYTQK